MPDSESTQKTDELPDAWTRHEGAVNAVLKSGPNRKASTPKSSQKDARDIDYASATAQMFAQRSDRR